MLYWMLLSDASINLIPQCISTRVHKTDMHIQRTTEVTLMSRLAWNCRDCSWISVCNLRNLKWLLPTPASFDHIYISCSYLIDFCWSTSNDLILSCSLDGTAMLWYVSSGLCVRTVKDPDNAPIRVCRFQPINNNMIVVSFVLALLWPYDNQLVNWVKTWCIEKWYL